MKNYQLPDPQKQPDAFLVLVYKSIKRVEFDDRAWDKIYFARCMKRVQELVEIFRGDFAAAGVCMKELSDKFYDASLDFTIETIIAHSFDWKAEREKKTDRECLRRLLGAYTEGAHKELARADPSKIIEALARPDPSRKELAEPHANS